jgi:hypothetical protein
MSFATVKVDRPGKRVVLFLSSRAPTTWKVSTSRGTRLERIVLGGYNQQKIVDELSLVPVENLSFHANPENAISGLGGHMPSRDVLEGERVVDERPTATAVPNRREFDQIYADYVFTRAAKKLRRLTGLAFTTFTAQSTLRRDTQIVVLGPNAWSLAEDPKSELHGVSIYRGFYDDPALEHTFAVNHPLSKAVVKIDRPGKNVVLFLAAYEPTEWDVQVTDETILDGIILGGYFSQKTVDRLKDTKVLLRTAADDSRNRLLGTYGQQPSVDVWNGNRSEERAPTNRDEARANRAGSHFEYQQRKSDYEYTQTIRRLKEITGIECNSFLIENVAKVDSPIVIGRPNK